MKKILGWLGIIDYCHRHEVYRKYVKPYYGFYAFMFVVGLFIGTLIGTVIFN